ncbi:MAG: gliding motility protein GldM [Flavobacteriales bacterium]|nr:gliding motility protein GldM [Flavobacteriales bacterium]
MAGGKLPPRQKMIGMMYLVLTALLAMNVSKDILNAFVTVNDGLEKTKHNFKEKNADQYSDFAKSNSENPVKTGPYYKKALSIKKIADEIVSHIDNIKVEIIVGIEPDITRESAIGKNQFGEDTIVNLKHVKVKDNYLFSTNLLVGGDPVNPKTGELSAMELKGKLEFFRDAAKKLVTPKGAIDVSLDETFTFNSAANAAGVVENWPSYNFHGVPAAATITLLTKMQTDVRNAESDVIKYLYSSVDAASYKFTGLDAAVIPESNYIIRGDSFRAQVFLAAFDTTMKPIIKLGTRYDTSTYAIGGDTVGVEIVNGKGYIKIPTNSLGLKEYKGVIDFKGPAGEIEHYPYSIAYQVAAPSTTISATAMNVFYIGVPNPVDISASGVAKDKVTASISNGTISKKGEGWVVNVRKPGKATISVNAEVDGARKTMGSMEFRVKKIPTPIAEIGGKSSGAIPKGKLASTAGIIAKMESFEFDVRVTVASFKFVYTQANGLSKEVPVTGPRFNDRVKKILRAIKPGSRVTFEDIKAKMPDGELRRLGSIVLKAV